MKILPTFIDGLFIVESLPIGDKRGTFLRCFCTQKLSTLLGERQVLQVNYSQTESVGAIRGMHYQRPPYAEMKLIRCLHGRVLDVAVDLRRGSNTFLKWHAEELTPQNCRMIVIPEGFAHGFQVLEPSSELLYLHTALYAPPSEGGARYDDPRLNIQWPLEPADLSERDQKLPLLDSSFEGISL